MVFGQRIKYFRRKARLSQQELADMVGIQQTLISRIERDDRKVTVDELPTFAKALGVSVSELLGEGEVAADETLAHTAAGC